MPKLLLILFLFILGVWPSFSPLDWINKVYPKLQPKDKPLECVQEEGEFFYLVSVVAESFPITLPAKNVGRLFFSFQTNLGQQFRILC